MDKQTLEPCPFCGTEFPMHGMGAMQYYIECRDCPAVMEDDTKAGAIAAWNTRAAHSVMAGKVAELTGLLEPFANMVDANMNDPLSKWLRVAHIQDAAAALAPHPEGME